MGQCLLGKIDLQKFAFEVAPLIVVLFGVALVAFSLGPYDNWDVKLEFEASSNAFKIGVPYVASFGAAIDQPPLGFYTEALCYAVFGLSQNTAVAAVTLFGLGSTVLVYLLGRVLYGKTAGLVAAALFGLNPWHLVLSRSALIDVQCLLLSLLCLLIGIFAIRKNSAKLTLLSGLVFAAAFMTKFYAVFVLLPLVLFYLYSRPKNSKNILRQTAVFAAPTLVFAFFWYSIFLGRSLLSIFSHNDLVDVIPAKVNVVASPFFATNFLWDYGLGVFLTAAIVFSLFLGLMLRKPRTAAVDLTWFVSLAVVVAVNVLLGFVLNLNVPYFSAFKYLYQALPYCALLGASLAAKAISLRATIKSEATPKKQLDLFVVAAAVVLLALSLAWSIYTTSYVSSLDYLQYRVEPMVDYGYALLNPAPLTVDSPLLGLQEFGFIVVVFGLGLAGMLKLLEGHLRRSG